MFFLLKNFGAEALGDIRVDLLPRMTPPRDPTGMSPQDPPTIMNISSSGNSKCFVFKVLVVASLEIGAKKLIF